MALGRAFIEVHADLKPFKKSLGKEVSGIVKETQKTVGKAVEEAANSEGGGGGRRRSRKRGGFTIKPKIDTSDADRDSKGFFRRFEKLGKKSWDGIVDSFGQAVENSGTVRSAGIALAVIVGAVASPLLAAAIAGAVTAGLGLAGIGAGVALAFQDARIKSAASEMWKGVMERLTNASAVFVKPIGRALDLLSAGIDRFLPRIERIFAGLAPYVDDLGSGIAGFLDALGPGLEAAFGNAGPLIQIVGEYLPVIGDALGYLFQQLSESEGVRAGLVVFFQMLGDAIVYTTDIITFLSDAFGKFVKFIYPLIVAAEALNLINVPDGFVADLGEMVNAMNMGVQPAEALAGGLFKIRGGASGAADSTTDLTASLNNFFSASLGWMDANIRFEEALDGVTKSLKDNGKNIDINTAKGRANVSAVNDTIKAAIAARDAKIKETGSVSAGNAVYATQIERLRGVLRSAGLTKGQIEKLIGAYDDIPPEVSTDVNVSGLSTALTQAQRLNAELAQIGREKRAAKQSKRSGSGNGTGGYAEGGVVRREQLAWVGEGNKPEAIVPLTNPRRAAEVMNEAGLTGFGGGTIVVQMVLDGKVIDERVVKAGQQQARKIQQQPRKVL